MLAKSKHSLSRVLTSAAPLAGLEVVYMVSNAHKQPKVAQEWIQQTALASPVCCSGMEEMEMEFKAGSGDTTVLPCVLDAVLSLYGSVQ